MTECNQIENIRWCSQDREKYLSRLQDESFDLVIIGGGITGAGIAREAALRGIKTAILDKEDFAFGTSSRSSKLAHGGFRYLGNGEFKIVRESTTERNWLRNHFSHNIRPTLTNIGQFTYGKLSKTDIKLGITLYDFISNVFSKYKQYKKHRFLSKEEALKAEPNLDSDSLLMMGQYYDTHVDDARLTLENIKEAILIGNTIAMNYCEVKSYLTTDKDEPIPGHIVGVKVVDNLSGKEFTIKGTQFINATGIWTDDLLSEDHEPVIRHTKGVHVIVPQDRVGNNDSMGLTSIDDGRVFFVLERDGYAVIGTTDTDYDGNHSGKINQDLGLPYCSKEDCDYLFNTVNTVFPNAKLTYKDIISTYAGIRPLVMEPGKSESKVSRKHVILDSPNGLTTICGGKLTTYRLMAEEILYHIIKNKGGFHKVFPKYMLKKGYSKKKFLITLLPEEWEYEQESLSAGLNLDKLTLDLLYQQYGKGAVEILCSIRAKPEWSEKIHPDYPFIVAEIHYILKHEFAPHLFDVLRRRMEISMKIRHNQQAEVAEKVAQIMAKTYDWDTETVKHEISVYLDHIKRTIWF